MDRLRTDIWDFVYKRGPQTIMQITEGLRLNEEMVNLAVDHEWFDKEGETIVIATQEDRQTRVSGGV